MYLLKLAALLLLPALPRCKATALADDLQDASIPRGSERYPYTTGPRKPVEVSNVPAEEPHVSWQDDAHYSNPLPLDESHAPADRKKDPSSAEDGSSDDVGVAFVLKLIKSRAVRAGLQALWNFTTVHNNASGVPPANVARTRSSLPVLTTPVTTAPFQRGGPTLTTSRAPTSSTTTTTTTTTTTRTTTTTTTTNTTTTITTTTTTSRSRRKWPRSTSSTRSPPVRGND